MNTPWILDKNPLERSQDFARLDSALERAGIPYTVLEWDPVKQSIQDVKSEKQLSWREDYPASIGWGSKFFCKELNRIFPDKVTLFGYTEKTQYLTYTNYLPEIPWLNEGALCQSWSWIQRNPNLVQEKFGGKGVFLRPNSGWKTFTGQTVDYLDWKGGLAGIESTSSVNEETLTVIAPKKELLGEFRFVIADGLVVTGSEYRWDNKLDLRRDWPPECEQLAAQIAQHDWQLDSAYIADIALTPYGPRAIELNGFCTSGLYACNMDKIVEAISALAEKELGEQPELCP